uniref:torsin-1A-like n=1 Tax=Pristiophorus japonicus TaxID=55135 RepID=UPI00398E8765
MEIARRRPLDLGLTVAPPQAAVLEPLSAASVVARLLSSVYDYFNCLIPYTVVIQLLISTVSCLYNYQTFLFGFKIGLETDLRKNLFGKHIAIDVIPKVIKGFLSNSEPQKAFTLSMAGVVLAKSLSQQLQEGIHGNVSACERSMFIFDEMDKMHPDVIDSIIPFLGNYKHLDGVSYRKAIFIFLSFHSQVKEAQVKPAEGKCHNLEPGEFVYIKIFKRKSSLQPRFEGPYQVLLATNTAIKVKERPTWIYASHCKRAPDQEEGKKESEEQKKEV